MNNEQLHPKDHREVEGKKGQGEPEDEILKTKNQLEFWVKLMVAHVKEESRELKWDVECKLAILGKVEKVGIDLFVNGPDPTVGVVFHGWETMEQEQVDQITVPKLIAGYVLGGYTAPKRIRLIVTGKVNLRMTAATVYPDMIYKLATAPFRAMYRGPGVSIP